MNAPLRPVRINRNENAWGCSPAVLKRLAGLTPEDIARYPDDSPLQAELARFLGMSVEQVRITAAGDEAIRMVIDGVTREGDTVVVPEPEFPIFRWCADARNRVVRTVNLDRDYNYEVNPIMKAAAGADLLVLMSPHNPAGCTLEPEDMETILRALQIGRASCRERV